MQSGGESPGMEGITPGLAIVIAGVGNGVSPGLNGVSALDSGLNREGDSADRRNRTESRVIAGIGKTRKANGSRVT